MHSVVDLKAIMTSQNCDLTKPLCGLGSSGIVRQIQYLTKIKFRLEFVVFRTFFLLNLRILGISDV